MTIVRRIAVLTMIVLPLNSWCQLSMSVLGDSYSAFEGFVEPDSNAIWYAPDMQYNNNVRQAEAMWWWLLADTLQLSVQRNNSFSGSTICNTGYFHRDYSDRSFVARMNNIGTPDLLIVFGGTNDCWIGVPLGEYTYSDWSKDQLLMFRPALCRLLDQLRRQYPQTMTLFVCNSDLKEPYTTSMKDACHHYGIDFLQLTDIDKQSGHPSVLGMKQISRQIADFLASSLRWTVCQTHRHKMWKFFR
ncbi:MAG: SGNH/GDSL hydrolase family protein [Prevotella sp.]|nr:SGNH/GDSL hydrolase family protein [Prevotella sp.]